VLEEEAQAIAQMKNVGKKTAAVLVEGGYGSIRKLAGASEKDISRFKGIGKKKAKAIIDEAKKIGEEKTKST